MREGAYYAGSVAKDQITLELASVQFAPTAWHAVPGQRWGRNLKLDKRNFQRCTSFRRNYKDGIASCQLCPQHS